MSKNALISKFDQVLIEVQVDRARAVRRQVDALAAARRRNVGDRKRMI